MKKELKDYLNLYLPFDFNFFGFTYKVIAFRDAGKFYTIWHEHGFFDVLKEDFKLPLRRLDRMTEGEMKEYRLLELPTIKSVHKYVIESAFYTRWLLSKHFDLFDLIPSGLAIDAETITK